jgi:ATP-dependent RNA helicase DeaD
MIHPFEALGLHADVVRAVTELGFEQPTSIQVEGIPPLLDGRDVLGQAQTGTGKTAAFGLPLLQRFDSTNYHVQALVLTPTRELALQTAEALEQYGKYRGVRVAPIYGGSSYSKQIRTLREGAQVVVGTPGRIIDLLERKALRLDHTHFVVLDEADRMLDLGFIDDVEIILKQIPQDRQTALFSATFPNEVLELSSRYMREPVTVRIARQTVTVEQTEQRYYLVREEDKFAALLRLLEVEDVRSALIFTRTKLGAATLAENLIARSYLVEAIHGDLAQDVRETIMRRFRQGYVTTLVATDVMARGLDIESVSHVINYDIPFDPEDYVHRIGRTGRAGREGVALTLVTPRERRLLHMIEHFIRQKIARAPLPTREEVLAVRDTRFLGTVQRLLEHENLSAEQAVVAQMVDAGLDPTAAAAAMVRLARSIEALRPIEEVSDVPERSERREREGGRWNREKGGRFDDSDRRFGPRRTGREAGMVRLVLTGGKANGITPADVVGGVASESGIPGKSIGAIEIGARETFFDVRQEYAERVLRGAGRLNLRGQWMQVRLADDGSGGNRERDTGYRGGPDDRRPQRRPRDGERLRDR